eukprot:jgi/Bigna1/78995/fgenesh1_pg.58_\
MVYSLVSLLYLAVVISSIIVGFTTIFFVVGGALNPAATVLGNITSMVAIFHGAAFKGRTRYQCVLCCINICLHRVSTPDDKAIAFVVSIGHESRSTDENCMDIIDRNVAEGVVKALKSSGISGESLLSMVRTMAGRWEVGEDAGLETLIASVLLVREELARSEGLSNNTTWSIPIKTSMGGQ